MIIELNGRTHEIAEGTTVSALIESVHGSTRGSAVVVDGAVVPRSEWNSTPLGPRQVVELITAVQGG